METTSFPPKRTYSSPPAGQMMLIIARWTLVLAGLLLVLWNPSPVNELRVKLIFLLLLAASNFYLCAQVLRRQPAARLVLYLTSLADLLVISGIIIWEGGFYSPAYIFYFPALLVISVAFPTMMLYAFTSSLLAVYTLICVFSEGMVASDLQALVIRLLMFAAVAVCGNLYWRLERSRRRVAARSQGPSVIAKEAAEDIFFGQIVIIWARWFFILAATILVLWLSETASEVTAGILLVAFLMAVNFFMHGRYLVEKPANRLLILLSCMFDLFLISFVVMNGQGGAGLESQFFIFYYPLFFAFALVFPPAFTALYTLAALCCYGLACLVADPSFLFVSTDLKQLIMRLVTLAAMSALGAYYYRAQRRTQRRSQRQRSQAELDSSALVAGIGDMHL